MDGDKHDYLLGVQDTASLGAPEVDVALALIFISFGLFLQFSLTVPMAPVFQDCRNWNSVGDVYQLSEYTLYPCQKNPPTFMMPIIAFYKDGMDPLSFPV